METFLTILIIWFSFLGLMVFLLWRREGYGKSELPFRDTVCVNTIAPDNESIRGVLTAQSGNYLSISDASLLGPDNAWHPIPGVAIIPIAKIGFIQHVAAEPELHRKPRTVSP